MTIKTAISFYTSKGRSFASVDLVTADGQTVSAELSDIDMQELIETCDLVWGDNWFDATQYLTKRGMI